MRKFTKEIATLLAAATVGASVNATYVSSEEAIKLSGQMTTSDDDLAEITHTAGVAAPSDDIVPTVGEMAPSDVVTKPVTPTTTTTMTTTTLIGTVTGTITAETTTTAIPSFAGGIWSTPETTTTEEIPPLMGDVAYPTTTTAVRIPPIEGTMIAPTTTSTTTTTIPPLAGTMTSPRTTTTTTTIPPLMGTVTGSDTAKTPVTTTTGVLPPFMGAETTEGDSNCDGNTDMSDAVLIMQALANPNKYGEEGAAQTHMTYQGRLNADMNGDGLTVGDAQAVQRKLLGYRNYYPGKDDNK